MLKTPLLLLWVPLWVCGKARFSSGRKATEFPCLDITCSRRGHNPGTCHRAGTRCHSDGVRAWEGPHHCSKEDVPQPADGNEDRGTTLCRARRVPAGVPDQTESQRPQGLACRVSCWGAGLLQLQFFRSSSLKIGVDKTKPSLEGPGQETLG